MEIGIYAIGGSIAAASGATLARFAVGPSFQKKRARWIDFVPENEMFGRDGLERVVLQFETRDGWSIRKSKMLVYVKRVGDDEVVAISAECTHLGCIVTWDESRGIFKCPCHDGKFDAEGRVIGGPPPSPLRRHPAKIDGRRIVVSTETVAYGGKAGETV